MENLIEKLKTVDKKVWIGVGIGAAVLIIVIVALVIGGKKPAGGNTQGTQAGTETEIATEVFGTEDVTEVLGTETTETEMGTETEMTDDEGQGNGGQSQAQGVGGTTVTYNEAVNGVEQKPTTADGTAGLGTAEMPYEITPDGNEMKFTTYDVPANGSAYYSVMKTVGKYFIIEDADAYVVYNGVRHDASNGKVSFLVTNEKALSTDYLVFEIGNKSSSPKKFTVKISDPYGSQMNPESISGTGVVTTHLNFGDTLGYYYTFKVPQKKTIRFYIVAESSTCTFEATRVRGDIPMLKTFGNDVQEDAKGKYIEFTSDNIEAGDVMKIHIVAEKYRGNIPEAEITWEIVYVD